MPKVKVGFVKVPVNNWGPDKLIAELTNNPPSSWPDVKNCSCEKVVDAPLYVPATFSSVKYPPAPTGLVEFGTGELSSEKQSEIWSRVIERLLIKPAQ